MRSAKRLDVSDYLPTLLFWKSCPRRHTVCGVAASYIPEDFAIRRLLGGAVCQWRSFSDAFSSRPLALYAGAPIDLFAYGNCLRLSRIGVLRSRSRRGRVMERGALGRQRSKQ